ncbi:MAG: hypothetical protein AAF492_30685 [Verrucomicrobiota bacterium]
MVRDRDSYQERLRLAFRDRIDIHVEVPAVRYEEISSLDKGEPYESIRKRVIRAREIQQERFKGLEKVHRNADMRAKQRQKYVELDADAQNLLKMAVTELHLSARAYDRILKVSRTLADLDNNSEKILSRHISEAIHYRSLDRELWD